MVKVVITFVILTLLFWFVCMLTRREKTSKILPVKKESAQHEQVHYRFRHARCRRRPKGQTGRKHPKTSRKRERGY